MIFCQRNLFFLTITAHQPTRPGEGLPKPSPSLSMAAASVRAQVFVLLLLLLVCSSHAMSRSVFSGRVLMGSNYNTQGNSNQIPNCNDMSSASHCSQNPKCRWCRSDALDDMCFFKSEASRLPNEVFSCN